MLALTPGIAVHAQGSKPIQSWTASDGRVIEAQFVRLDDETVVIQKDGKPFAVPLAKLNADSVALAKKLSRELGPAGDAAKIQTVPAPPAGFALIPAGEFTMGDALDGDKRTPQHKVKVSAFYMQQKVVSKAEWNEVRAWALQQGYTDLPVGQGKAADHPVHTVTWYNAVKWCNAKSVKDGLTPCYYTDSAQKAVYQTGAKDINNTMVKWRANGYRLPTEAEWEKAARGGLSGKRFPWGDTISHEQGNFTNSCKENYQYGTTDAHPSYKTGGEPHTSPVGSFMANGYGLYDMAGNVQQWCWDWHGNYPAALETDPRGAACGSDRALRGGCWYGCAEGTRCAARCHFWPDCTHDIIGFRMARGQP